MEPNKRKKTAESSLSAPFIKKEILPEEYEDKSLQLGFFVDIINKYNPGDSDIRIKEDISEKAGIIGHGVTTEIQNPVKIVPQRKEHVKHTASHCTIEGVQFDVMGSADISRISELEIEKRELYYYLSNKPYPLGILDLKLGCNRTDTRCETCGKGLMECVGHWGYIHLQLPVFHVGFFKYTIQLLYCICKRCSRLLLPDESVKKLQESHKRQMGDPLLKLLLFKRILQECRKVSKCPGCNARQGVIKRIVKPTMDQFMKLLHVVKFKEGGRMQTVEEELNPLAIHQLFEAIDPVHCKVLNVVPPEKLLISNLAVPPSCIRPSVSIEGQGTTEDDLTCIFSDIVELNNVMKTQIRSGFQTNQFIGNWQFLQLQCTRLINADAPAVSQLLASKNISKPGRGICQRLKGKEGRFRGNLSGKRVDFSARTVISPDPNVAIDEVVVPEWIARKLTFPEKVSSGNLSILRKAVLNGVYTWPGAAYVHKLDGGKCSLRFANPKHVAENLQVGDVVERHLWNGDIVLFNRQPSLHRMSIMAHRARVMKGSTFRFNECVCQPYNADFDGDEMNLHLPQTYEARAEALHILSVLKNLTTPRNGEPLIAAVQDFLSASYLLTCKDRFLNRSEFCQLCCYFTDASMQIDLPAPAILHPTMLWTGKQVFNVLLRPNRKCKVMVNFECREREFQSPESVGSGISRLNFCMCPKDGYVVFYRSELMCGALGKKSLGASKDGLFYQLLHRNSAFMAAECMLRVSKLTSRWLADFGMTIGLDDVRPGDSLLRRKQELLQDGYAKVTKAIENFDSLQAFPGCTREETLELQVKGVLDELRNEAGKVCNAHLRSDNKPLVMFNSGAKGALINIAQMVACVGQQNVSGQRIQNGFIGRTLPHFDIGCMDAKSRGFVANSFFSGLEPEEFFFHTMSGREGLIDTAVKTSETGYMQRRLMKALEDLAVCYDHTVRTSDGLIVQFLYGDDGLGSSSTNLHTEKALEETLKHIISIGGNVKVPLNILKLEDPEQFEILPPPFLVGNDEELLKMIESVPINDDLIEMLPYQLKQKAKTYLYWKECAANSAAKNSRFRPLDSVISQNLLKNLAAYIVVYRYVPRYKRNLPLFPFEIMRWGEFLQPLCFGLLPASIRNHMSLSHAELPTHQKGTEREFLYGDLILETLGRWTKKMGQSSQKSDYDQICKLFHRTSTNIYDFRMKCISCQNRISVRQIFEFIRCCWSDYQKAVCEPGEAIGALGAQSIGEPGTQMTLKTFHFAGVASMNVTLGVPRIKEIINAANTIQTPIIEVPLLNSSSYNYAMAVKARIEKTTLGQICRDIREIYSPSGILLLVTLNDRLIKQLLINVDSVKVRSAILEQGIIGKFKLGKQDIRVVNKWQLALDIAATRQQFFHQHVLITGLLQTVVAGGKNIKRAIIKKGNVAGRLQYQLAVEGYGLHEVIGTPGVLSAGVKSNHVMEVAKVLGIEAARSVIMSEIKKCMDAYSIDIDSRYMKLLGDVMTFRGEVIGINRFGIQKMRASTLMLASFEETNEHLFEAAVHHRKDPIRGVSECIIMGKPIPLGTGSFDLLLDLGKIKS